MQGTDRVPEHWQCLSHSGCVLHRRAQFSVVSCICLLGFGLSDRLFLPPCKDPGATRSPSERSEQREQSEPWKQPHRLTVAEGLSPCALLNQHAGQRKTSLRASLPTAREYGRTSPAPPRKELLVELLLGKHRSRMKGPSPASLTGSCGNPLCSLPMSGLHACFQLSVRFSTIYTESLGYSLVPLKII